MPVMRRIVTAVSALSVIVLTGCGNIVGSDETMTDVPPATEAEEETVPETEPATVPPTEPEPSPAEKKLAEMSLHEKVCQMLIVTPEALCGCDAFTAADEAFSAAYQQYPVGGFIFFAKNIQSEEQTRSMLADVKKISLEYGIGAFLSADEEGGSVTRIQQQLGTETVNSMSWYGGQEDSSSAFDAGAVIGGYMSELGFDLDFAPVADVNISPYNELGNRIFSTDAGIVSERSAAVVEGLHSAGVMTTLKHFPGLGAGNGNTHYGSVLIERSIEQLRETEFAAFRGGIDAGTDLVMIGHQITTASGDELPGDLSPVVVTEWLRKELGFSGIAITDSHSMGAIANSYEPGEAAVLAVQAGIDVILMPADTALAAAGIEEAVSDGTITEERIDESVLRILQKKEQSGLIRP